MDRTYIGIPDSVAIRSARLGLRMKLDPRGQQHRELSRQVVPAATQLVDYEERGDGPKVVLVPGSCSTAAAWRPIVANLEHRFKCVTTSLLGYGGTAERRSVADTSIAHECEAIETVVRRAGGRVHLVGHSFGGLVALAVAMRGKVSLASLTILEAPAAELLRDRGEDTHYRAFRALTRDYFADYASGNPDSVAAVIDFYGGAGTFAAWPERARAYAVETTDVNMLDWASAYGFSLSAAALSSVAVPTSICVGATSHPAVQRANELLSQHVVGASLLTIEGAGHFMVATHPLQVSRVIAAQVREAEALRRRARNIRSGGSLSLSS